MPSKTETREQFEMTAVEHGIAPSDWALPASSTSGGGDGSNTIEIACCCCCCIQVYVN